MRNWHPSAQAPYPDIPDLQEESPQGCRDIWAVSEACHSEQTLLSGGVVRSRFFPRDLQRESIKYPFLIRRLDSAATSMHS